MYHTLYFHGSKIACFFHGADLIEYVERSILAGCPSIGWRVRFSDGRFRDLVVDVKVHF